MQRRLSTAARPRPTLLVLALLTAFGTARGQSGDDTVPVSSVTLGIAGVSGNDADRALFGQYNGLRTHDVVGLFGFDVARRDEDSGVSMRLEGRNLFGQTRELDLRWKKQGDWKLTGQLAEGVRHEPQSASSGEALRLKRTRLGIALAKTLGPDLQLDISLSSENKDGARLWGIGMACPSALAPTCGPTTGTETGWAVLLRPEPVHANHSQIEARLSYAGDRLHLSGGYYGSFYQNRRDSLAPNVPAVLNNPLGVPLPLSAGLQALLDQPVALPPDNQAHQLDLSGLYRFTPATQLSVKLSRSRATQHQDFAAAGFTDAPTGVTNLGGRIDTTLAQASLSARPLAKLALLAKLRYVDVDDSTPIAPYNVEGSAVYTNRRLPSTRVRGQLLAHYQFSSDYRGTLGAEQENIDRGLFTATSAVSGLTALRQKTDETTLRAELRRRMNEDVSGAISVARSRRSGSNWLRDNSGLGLTEVADPNDPATGFARGIFMPTLADRQRDTAKVSADWQPAESFSLQFSAQSGVDRYTTPSAYGLRKTGLDQVNLDANYALNPRWSINAGLSWSNETLRQARPDAAVMDFDNTGNTLSLGLVGKPMAALQIGASLWLVDDRSVYRQTLDAGADGASAALLAATGGLPDIVFRQTQLKLFGRYELNKQSEWRIDLWHLRSTWNDWAWGYNGVPFSFSDGTTVGSPLRQRVTLVALSYVHRWK